MKIKIIIAFICLFAGIANAGDAAVKRTDYKSARTGITDDTTTYAYRQISDNTNVINNNTGSTANIDYCITHPDDCIETHVKIWEDFPENTTIDPYFPVLVSYEGDDEDISGTLPASQSALVPAMYLYYLNNEQEKAQLQENISNAVEITVTTIAIVGTDGAAAPLFLGGTRFAATAIKVYRAANYVSLGLAITDWGTESPEIAELRNKYGLLMAAVDLPDILTTAPKAWRSVKKLAHNSKTSIIAIGKVSKLTAVDFYTALKNCGNQLSQLPEATRNKVMKLYYYLRKQRLLDDAVSGGRFIARSGIELRTHLNSLSNKPLGKNYTGDVYRSLSKQSEVNYGALPNQMTDHHIYSSWGRYDVQGEENAMYLSKTVSGNQTELVPHYGEWNDFSTYKYDNVKADNLLDLTDDIVRQQLGTEFEQLTIVLDDKAVMYEFTNELAQWARQNNYNGLIVPGARGAKNYENVIIFNQTYINLILQGKTAIPIPK